MTTTATLIKSPKKIVDDAIQELVYELDAESGDEGTDIQTGLNDIVSAHAELWEADYGGNEAITTGRTAVAGQVKIAFADPGEDCKGRLIVVGRKLT